jgi:hypothetical protein
MKKVKAIDFQKFGESLRADIQDFLNTYAAKHPEDGPILAFCLYFDSQAAINGMVLPQKALARKIGVDDPAAWFQYADHIDAPLSERTEKILSDYEEVFWDEEQPDEAHEIVIQQFHQMLAGVIQQLNFDRLLKTDDFIFYADGMDENYEQWKETIPPALLKKYFGI